MDRLFEFLNSTKTYADLAAGVPIVTNAAGEQAVIRDILIDAPNAPPLRIKSGASTLASLQAARVQLTGAEIVGASSALMIDTALAPILNRVGFFPATSGATAYTLTLPTRFSGGWMAAPAAALTATTVTAPTNSQAAFACASTTGDVYYAANGSSYLQLYKRAGGPAGAQTTVDATFGQAICWDGAHTIYGITGTTLKILDTTTGAVTTKAITGGPGAIDGNCHISVVDGYILMRPAYGSGTLWLVSAATGAATSLGVTAGVAGAIRCFLALTKTASGRFVALQATASTTIAWWDLGTSLAAPVVGASGTITLTAAMTNYYADWNGLVQPVLGSDVALLIDSSATNAKLIVIDLVNKVTLSTAPPGVTNVTNVTPYPLTVDAAAASADFGAVTVRATGIKTTEG